AQLVRLVRRRCPLGPGPTVLLPPRVEAVDRHPQPIGHLCHRVAAVRHLPDRFNLELFRVPLAAHGHSCCCRGLWLQGVYETRGETRRTTGMPARSRAPTSASVRLACTGGELRVASTRTALRAAPSGSSTGTKPFSLAAAA